MCAGQRIGHGKTDVNFWAQAAAKSLALLDAESLKARTVASPERSGHMGIFRRTAAACPRPPSAAKIAPKSRAIDHHHHSVALAG